MKRLIGVAAVLACLAAAPVALADAGVPMLAVVWPAAWVLLLPIVGVEAVVATRTTALGVKKSLLGSAVANAVSTIVAIPATWGLLVLVEILLPGGGQALGLSSMSSKVFAVTVDAPWLIPYESDLDWMIPVAALVLLVPFFFVSVFTERVAFRLSTGCEAQAARRWSWLANGITYGIVFALVATLAVHAVATHDRSPGMSQTGAARTKPPVNLPAGPAVAARGAWHHAPHSAQSWPPERGGAVREAGSGG